MKKIIELLNNRLSKIQAGVAQSSVLDDVFIDYYGVKTPIKNAANIGIPNRTSMIIQPFENSFLQAIEKAILKKNIGMTPINDGNKIILNVPIVTSEQREKLAALVRKHGEYAKINIRNKRRDKIKKAKQNPSEEEQKKIIDGIEKETKDYINKIESIVNDKEKSVMTI